MEKEQKNAKKGKRNCAEPWGNLTEKTNLIKSFFCLKGLRAELGKIKRRCYSLPGPDFTYGLNSFLREGGVATAIGQWHTLVPKATVQRKLQPHYIALNREAVKSGLVTAAEHQVYRNTHQIWRPVNEGRLSHPTRPFPPGTTFGISTRSKSQRCKTRGRRYSGGTSPRQTRPLCGSCLDFRSLVLTSIHSPARRHVKRPTRPIIQMASHAGDNTAKAYTTSAERLVGPLTINIALLLHMLQLYLSLSMFILRKTNHIKLSRIIGIIGIQHMAEVWVRRR
uniref:Uncharacterized protein n=1 Tax=Leptobrachium leishanense TaxID=445787 RepID=A0A8C5WKN4_9ANUR